MAEKTAKTKAAEAKTTKSAEKKEAAPKVEIIRGRMPLPIVHMIKFGTEGETDGAVATKFRTTNGKVSDVRKDRNFAYVSEGMTFSQSMLDGAITYADQLDDKAIVKAVKALKADDKADIAIKDARAALKPAKKGADKPSKKGADKPAEKVSDGDLDELTA